LRIPSNQLVLLEAVAKVNSNVIIVLVGGSAIEMDWEMHAKAILHMQLPGQAGGQAAAGLLFGVECPSGKLTESYPFTYSDVVNSNYYNVALSKLRTKKVCIVVTDIFILLEYLYVIHLGMDFPTRSLNIPI
jgi:hypothetical protein